MAAPASRNATGGAAALSNAVPLYQTRTISATYDGLGRLIGAQEQPGTTFAYAYDVAGNRTGVWVNGVQTTALSYDAADQVVGWQYDAAGNLLSDGTSRWSYDALGRMVSAARGLDSRTYTYNGDGILVGETSGGNTTRYAQDMAAPLNQVLQMQQDGRTTRVVYGQERLFSTENGARMWYGADALGSVRQTTNDAGASGAPIWYDPWGEVEQGNVPVFGFTGELHDTVLGQVHLRARWYTPALGTFTSRDPFLGFPEHPDSFHPYHYALSDPLRQTDPSGQVVQLCPTGYRPIWERNQFKGCEDDPTFPDELSALKGTTPPLPGPGIVGTAGGIPNAGAATLEGVAKGLLPELGGKAAQALGKAVVCTAASLAILDALWKALGRTQANTDTQQRRQDRILVSHYTTRQYAEQAMFDQRIVGGSWENGFVFVMEGRSTAKRALLGGAQSAEARIVFEVAPSELIPDPEIAHRMDQVKAGLRPLKEVVFEARRFVRPGPVMLVDRKPALEIPSFWERW